MLELVHQLFNKFRLFYRENWIRGIEPEDYDELVDMWCESLNGCSEYQIQQACNRIVTGLSGHNTFSPSPGEFVELARSIRHPDAPSCSYQGPKPIERTPEYVSMVVSNLFKMRDIFLEEYDKKTNRRHSEKRQIMKLGTRSASLINNSTKEKENA
jgi:hypothetical protein